jgi:hypothetical protein
MSSKNLNREINQIKKIIDKIKIWFIWIFQIKIYNKLIRGSNYE